MGSIANSSPRVVVRKTPGRVDIDKVHSILSNRFRKGEEEYLVRWTTTTPTEYPPLSWHSIGQLDQCLEVVQDYLTAHYERQQKHLANGMPQGVKRKSPDGVLTEERRPSPSQRRSRNDTTAGASVESLAMSFGSRASPIDLTDDEPYVYNGILTSKNGYFHARQARDMDIPRLSIQDVPTKMLATALRSSTDRAARKIRAACISRLAKLHGKPVTLTNIEDASTPSLRFRFITEYVFGDGVTQVSNDAQVGCQSCSPSMGRGIGCEYTRKCDCLEFAAVDESRLSEEERVEYEEVSENGGPTTGFPKKFPYFTSDLKTQRAGSLVGFYLNSRHAIYECNHRCRCGPYCRNKNVQFGRQIPLEIFKTPGGRGWGLRCPEDIHKGQFIDTYRGEVITDAEATRREEQSSKAKASYLYSLDKFAGEELAEDDVYVVDGEFMGGPTIFMNHSCQPNCRQYTVSYNKYDYRIYDIAFFACRDIPAGEELTFDYLDKEEGEGVDAPGDDEMEDAIPCLCKAKKCRKWLWT